MKYKKKILRITKRNDHLEYGQSERTDRKLWNALGVRNRTGNDRDFGKQVLTVVNYYKVLQGRASSDSMMDLFL